MFSINKLLLYLVYIRAPTGRAKMIKKYSYNASAEGASEIFLGILKTYASEMQSPQPRHKFFATNICPYNNAGQNKYLSRYLSHNASLTTSFSQRLPHNVFLTTSFLQCLSHNVFLTPLPLQCRPHNVFLTTSQYTRNLSLLKKNVPIYLKFV